MNIFQRTIANIFGIKTEQPIPIVPEVIAAPAPPPTPPKVEEEEGKIEVDGYINDKGQIALKVDWNDAFIKELKKAGYNGANDEVIIQQYLATMHRNLLAEEKTNNDFT